MPRRKDDLVFSLIDSPWQAVLVFAGVVYACLAFLAPLIRPGNGTLATLIAAAPTLAWPVTGAILLLALISAARAWRRHKLLDRHAGLESVRTMPWREFQQLAGKGFSRLGYEVEERGAALPDSGVDLVLSKDGVRTLVQCKHWRSKQVGVQPVRELLGVMHAEKAHGALIVASGTFTREAQRFAREQPIGLIDGEALLELIQGLQQQSTAATDDTAVDHAAPACPTCARPMIKRQGRKGGQRGGILWGCTAYPVCRGTRPLA